MGKVGERSNEIRQQSLVNLCWFCRSRVLGCQGCLRKVGESGGKQNLNRQLYILSGSSVQCLLFGE